MFTAACFCCLVCCYIVEKVWSLELEKIALSWASNCRYDEGFADGIPDEYIHPAVGIGQNIWSRIGQ